MARTLGFTPDTRLRIISCTCAPFTSCLAQLLLPPVGQTSGFLSVTNSVSVNTGPCSKSSVTSTLPVFEAGAPGRPALQPRTLDAMSAESAQSYLTARARVALDSPMTALLRKEMDFEVAFVKAGGLLLAGPDPTGNGGVLPGFGDQREIELLVEAGFTPVEAIQIATQNGALYLGQQDRIGTLAPGKQADLVLIKGDPQNELTRSRTSRRCLRLGSDTIPRS